jgi:hypothetical protein
MKPETMKRIILFLALFASTTAGFGQKHIRLSFVGSPSTNWMVSDNTKVTDKSQTFGYDYGLNADFYFTEDERYSFLTGLLISNTGGEISYQNDADFSFSGETLPATVNIRYRLRYVEVPFSLKLKTDQFRRIRYWGQLGLTGMVNISAKADSNDGTFSKTNINDEINLFNLDMNMGAGIDYDLNSSNSISAGIVFQNGLLDVTTNNAFSDKTIVNSLKLKIGLNF